MQNIKIPNAELKNKSVAIFVAILKCIAMNIPITAIVLY